MIDLSSIQREEIARLREDIRDGELSWPASGFALKSKGYGHLTEALKPCLGLSPEAIALVLESVLAERAAAAQRPELVWSGPYSLRRSNHEPTADALRELFDSAQREVWMTGYHMSFALEMFEPLVRAMRERGVKAHLVLELAYEDGFRLPHSATDEELMRQAEAIFREKIRFRFWPKDAPKLQCYFYPETLRSPPPTAKYDFTAMHAKCVIIDERETLIGSANFSKQAQERNIEAGARIVDPRFAKNLVDQFRFLVGEGKLRRVE